MMNLEDYKLVIQFDKNKNPYWKLLRKGEPAVVNEKELKMVADMCIEIRDKIVMVLDEMFEK